MSSGSFTEELTGHNRSYSTNNKCYGTVQTPNQNVNKMQQ